MSLPYGPPAEVSPLIRGLRFGLLFAGIFYAFGKQKIYDSMEAARLEEEARKKVNRDKEMAILKAKIAKEEKEAVRQLETGELFKTEEEKAADAEWRTSQCRKSAEPKISPCPPKCTELEVNMSPSPPKCVEPEEKNIPCPCKCAEPEVKNNPCPTKVEDAEIKAKPCPNEKE